MSTAIAISTKKGFYERTVLSMLSKMNLGTLNLTLPSGEKIILGNGEGGISANAEIKSPYFFKRSVLYGDIGFGEAYVDGDWDTDNITNVIKWFLLNVDNAPSISGSSARSFIVNILKIFNNIYHTKRENTLKGSKKNISSHYDLNNDFFASFLDSTMTYSGAYFNKEGISLQEAQLAKYERLCKQLNLKAGDHVLEIGSGWGGNAIYIAKNYGCYVTSVTISEEQCKLAKERVEKENLSDKINIILQDYRFLKGQFDKIVSIEMLEAVGAKFYDAYFKKCHELLKKDGILGIQVITCPDSRFESLRTGVDWIQKHIFPGSLLPSVAAINRAINNTSDLTLVDLKDLGLDYARTLNLWREQFNKNISDIKKLGFDDEFIRKWNYYFCYCEAAFDMRNINVMQLVYARPNNITRKTSIGF
ncbi:MAG TPA: cyclopropane-fatty-acyl-phospholipid synthase family protein [Bacteroidia bacterium]|jgi:cyclopropane-fatty-acyl-phospholipid synthase|nr:cyclopropane-fatty-acyl-phospholipid synthase family protein [Bacteroidia bacterium]